MVAMKRFTLICMIILPMQFYCLSIYGDGNQTYGAGLSPDGAALLARGEGVVDDAVFMHIAAGLSVSDFRAALYGANRAHRRVALDAAGFFADPWEYIPWLVSFMGAAERQSASIAAASMFNALERVFDMRGAMQIPISRQGKQLMQMLVEIAADDSLELDIRVSAIRFWARISDMTGQVSQKMDDLIQHEAPEIRLAALQTLTLPLADAYLNQIGAIATEDASQMVRGAAVALLCENARSHRVTKPSADLKELIAELVAAEIDAESAAPALTCIARFSYQTRADLTDRINRCENEKIVKYWKSLSR